jgi:hypothetical protein
MSEIKTTSEQLEGEVTDAQRGLSVRPCAVWVSSLLLIYTYV